MEMDFINSSIDLIEGVVAGGLTGLGAFLIGNAVSVLPSAFISTTIVTPLSVIAGALAFVGYALPKIRARIK
jgi:multisubunit Na+/H+ antiporter MnhC subunit